MTAIAALAILAAPVSARDGQKRDSVGQDAVDAVVSPLTDLNLRKREIPPLLQLAQTAPYDMAGLEACDALWREIDALEEVLGPDADSPADKEGLANKALRRGSAVAYGFVPFRGVVRQVSGAKARKAQLEAAVYAGVARRSYLKGVARGRDCARPIDDPIGDATDVLGLSES